MKNTKVSIGLRMMDRYTSCGVARVFSVTALAFWIITSAVWADTAPKTQLQIEIDTRTGSFTATAVLEDPIGVIALPEAEWLTIDGLSFQGMDIPTADVSSAVIDAAFHQNRDLRMTVSGDFPKPDGNFASSASSTDATYSIGPVWFPVDATAIRDHHVTVIVPEPQQIAGTGRLMRVSREDGFEEVRLAFTGSSDDFGLFVGPYVTETSERAGVPLHTYFYEADAELSERYFDASGTFISRFEAEIGAYPYDEFSVVATPMPVGLGFAGLTYVSRDILSHRYMTGRSLAHEILHSWWGNAVGVTYESGNWSEGLTTFQADYGLAEDQGPDAARDMRVGWIRALAQLSDDQREPLSAFRSSTHNGSQVEGYGKAAMVFHMLRDELGTAAFQGGIRGFYATNRGAIAAWADLQTAFETAAGKDLAWFFDQWINEAGMPNLQLQAGDVTRGEDGTYQAALKLTQTAPAYRLSVPVVIETVDGPIKQHMNVSGLSHEAVITLPTEPISVQLDPDFDLVRHPLAGELAPTLRSIKGQTLVAFATSPSGGEGAIAAALEPILSGASVTWQDELDIAYDGPKLVVGSADELADLRPDALGPMPENVGQSATSLWIERDQMGQLWLFLTFDTVESLSEDLRLLRFYTGQSFVHASNGSVSLSGVWPDGNANLQVPFDPVD